MPLTIQLGRKHDSSGGSKVEAFCYIFRFRGQYVFCYRISWSRTKIIVSLLPSLFLPFAILSFIHPTSNITPYSLSTARGNARTCHTEEPLLLFHFKWPPPSPLESHTCLPAKARCTFSKSTTVNLSSLYPHQTLHRSDGKRRNDGDCGVDAFYANSRLT